MLIDTHGHVNLSGFNEDYDEVIRRSLENDTQIIAPSTQLPTSKKAIAIAEKYDGVWAAVGFHPTHVLNDEFDPAPFAELAKHPKVVAMGETGIDYYHVPESADLDDWKRRQRDVLQHHIDIATERNLPVITHCRVGKTPETSIAYHDLHAIIKQNVEQGKLARRGVVHCYVSDWETAKMFLDLDYMISFTGIITFAHDEVLLDAVRKIPLDRMMIETDSPYLTPVPHRGKRNEPWYVKFVALKIAELKGLTFDEVAEVTTQNARKFFSLR
ncbi:MAG: TatD family hydrolase [Candidatus Kerfeldbacteria bacterium]|nr:TatD family hydrolase [Candidatus Kerfeldbacteria bacterium]